MAAKQIQKLSFDEYIKIEESEDLKYEYHDGEIFSMSGGSINHATISGNIFNFLTNNLRKRDRCRTFNSDVKLNINKSNKYLYPDTSVVCGEIQTNDGIGLTNPTLIVEVLSDSTSEYDRGAKFHYYKQLESLKEYVLISQNEKAVDVFSKKGDLWKIERYTHSDVILDSLELSIPIGDIYENIEFE